MQGRDLIIRNPQDQNHAKYSSVNRCFDVLKDSLILHGFAEDKPQCVLNICGGRTTLLCSMNGMLLAQAIKLLAHFIKLLVHIMKLFARIIKLLAHVMKLLAHVMKLPAHITELLPRDMKLHAHIIKMLTHVMKLLAHVVKFLTHMMKLLAHILKFLIDRCRCQFFIKILQNWRLMMLLLEIAHFLLYFV